MNDTAPTYKKRTDLQELRATPIPAWRGHTLSLAVAVTGIALAVAIDSVGFHVLPIYFIPVPLICAFFFGFYPSVLASVILTVIQPFLFDHPVHEVGGTKAELVLSQVMFLLICVLVSWLIVRIRRQAATAQDRERRSAALYRLSNALAGSRGVEEVFSTIVRSVREILDRPAVILSPRGELLEVRAISDESISFAEAELATANELWMSRELGDVKAVGSWRIFALRTAGEPVGMLGVCEMDEEGMGYEGLRLIRSLCLLAAGAIEREHLAREAEEKVIAHKHEDFYAALLSSVSHDFRTPLASIIGAAETLLLPGAVFSRDATTDMLTMIRDEADRLNRFVANLLDMTKLESGFLELNREYAAIDEIVGTVLSRPSARLEKREIVLDLPYDLPMVRVDFVLMEHVLLNLLDNAAKYSPEKTPIRIEAKADGDCVVVRVIDEGKGIPEADRDRVFEKFYRAHKGDLHVAGTGLGLSICRGIVEAHEGTISAVSPVTDGKGTAIIVTLPAMTGATHPFDGEEEPSDLH